MVKDIHLDAVCECHCHQQNVAGMHRPSQKGIHSIKKPHGDYSHWLPIASNQEPADLLPDFLPGHWTKSESEVIDISFPISSFPKKDV